MSKILSSYNVYINKGSGMRFKRIISHTFKIVSYNLLSGRVTFSTFALGNRGVSPVAATSRLLRRERVKT